MAHANQTRRLDNVRIGPITIITLIAVICMAVLAVLAASTANATMTISQRQSDATTQMYRNESAAQVFVAGIDDRLAPIRAAGSGSATASQAVKQALDDICAEAREAGNNEVDVVAQVDGTAISAEFTCAGARTLVVAITIRDDASYRIDKWKMVGTQSEPQQTNQLWSGE